MDDSDLHDIDQYLLHPSLSVASSARRKYEPPRPRSRDVHSSSEQSSSSSSVSTPPKQKQPALPQFDLAWKFEFAFPELKTTTTSGLFLGKMDTIRRSTGDLSLTERVLYCQFWCCLISYLERNHITHSKEPLWFQCNTHLTDCYWYELLFRLHVAFDALLERMHGPGTPSSVHGDDVSELASKAIGCFAYFQKNTIHFREPELMKAYEILQEMMVRARVYALYYLANAKRVDSKRFTSFAVAFLEAHHEFRQSAERPEGWLTPAVVKAVKVDMHKAWTKQLIADGQLKDAYVVAEEVQTEAKTEFDSLKACLPTFSSLHHPKPKPKRFREPLLAEGFHPHKEPRCMAVEVFAALTPPPTPPPPAPPSGPPSARTQPPAKPIEVPEPQPQQAPEIDDAIRELSTEAASDTPQRQQEKEIVLSI
jgi:hypothetical protein